MTTTTKITAAISALIASAVVFVTTIDGVVVPTAELTFHGETITVDKDDGADHDGEKFRILVDKEDYRNGMTGEDVYFSVTNTGEPEAGNLSFGFSGEQSLRYISVLTEQSETREEPTYENGNVIDCTDPMTGDVVEGTCYEQIVTGHQNVTTTKQVWQELGMQNGNIDLDFPTGTLFFHSYIDYNDDKEGEFYIVVFSDSGEFGYVDPGLGGSGWTKRVSMTVDHTKVAADATDYPTLLTGANIPAGTFTDAKSDGCDLRFTSDEAGDTEIPFELAVWTPGSSITEIYVKNASVSSTTDTVFYMWYGNNSASCYAATDTYGRNNVWSDYELVMHMNDLTSTTLLDSTGNGHTATDSGTSNVEGNGKIGKCQVFNGNSYYNFGTITEFAGINKLSVAFWGKRTNGTNNIAEALNTTGAQAYSGNLNSYAYDSTGAYNIYNTFFQADTYEHLVQVYDGTQSTNYTKMRVWKNGSEVSASRSSGTISSTLKNPAAASYISYTTALWIGEIDELRASINVLSGDWITTDYNNQNAPATFTIEGTPEDVGTVERRSSSMIF